MRSTGTLQLTFEQRTSDCAALAGEAEDEEGYAALQLLGQEKQFQF